MLSGLSIPDLIRICSRKKTSGLKQLRFIRLEFNPIGKLSSEYSCPY